MCTYPRTAETVLAPPTVIEPQAKQEAFLATKADIDMYGGETHSFSVRIKSR